MTTEEKNKIADVLNEKPHRIRIGWLFFKARPVTLGQIYEMGALANDIKADDLEDTERKVRIVPVILQHYNDAKIMQRIFVVCLFRSRIKRFLFGWYVRRKLTVLKFQELLNYMAMWFNANFFLTSIIFLKTDRDDDRAEPNDSPWATVGGVMKYFRMSYEEVVFNRSYINIILLNRSIPTFKMDKDENELDGVRHRPKKRVITPKKPMHASEFFMQFM